MLVSRTLSQRVLVALVPLHEFGDAVDGFLVDHNPLIRQQHQVKIHHAGMQFCYRFDFAILAFLQLRREHILKAVCLIERKRDRLVVGIDHQITATSLVVRIKIVPFEYRKILERPFTFCPQLSNFRGITHVKTAPFGALPSEVDGTAAPFCRLRIFYESLGSHSRQNRDIANW